MKRILREPLLHFLAAGALLFWLFDWLNDEPPPQDAIVIDSDRVASLSARFEQTWNRPPTEEEQEALINNWLEEELLYREGLALGLERNDPVVRRRIADQVAFISESLLDIPPDEEELNAWLEDNRERYRQPMRYSFRQVYFNPGQFGDNLMAAISQARNQLMSGEGNVTSSRTMLPEGLTDASPDQIIQVFGMDFARQLADLDAGEWSEPISSGFGVHIVFIDSIFPARDPELEEVHSAVERDLLHDRNQQARAVLIGSLRQRYDIVREDLMQPQKASSQ